MELTPRQKQILAAIVEHHISTGEPLGSKLLVSLLENAPSSATLRNEMNFLCEIGLLSQPHTSAGRVPTSDGYRFYVNSLMKEDEVDAQVKRVIDDTLKTAAADVEDLSKAASKLLSKITGLPAVSAVVVDENISLKKIKLIPLSGRVYMMVILLSDGRVTSRICRNDGKMNSSNIELFYKLCSKYIIDRAILSFTPAAVQDILAFAGLEALSLAPVFNNLSSLLKSVSGSTVDLNGESNVYSMMKREENAKKILSFIERKDKMLDLLSSINEPLSVVFGKETDFSELNPSALIVASFGNGENETGRIAVIGPTRMSYDRIIPSTKYLAARLSSLMSETSYDTED